MATTKEIIGDAEQYWFNDIFDAIKVITEERYNLERYARAFFTTGNEVMGEELSKIAEILGESTKSIQDAVGQECHDSTKQAEQASNNVILTALAMCDVIPREEAAKRIK